MMPIGGSEAGGVELPVAVATIGPITARIGEYSLSGADLGSRKARQLLLLLAVERPRRLSSAALVERLWEEDLPANPDRVLAGLVSRLRRALGSWVIEGGVHAGYCLASRVNVDWSEADGLLTGLDADRRHGDFEDAVGAAVTAVGLLEGGELGSDLTGPMWLDDARRDHEAMLRSARAAGWRTALQVDDLGAAWRFSADAAAADPLDEEATRALMTTEARRGNHREVRRHFQNLCRHLEADLGVGPDHETTLLYERLRANVATGPGIGVGGASHEGGRELVLLCAAILGEPFTADPIGELASMDVLEVHRILGEAEGSEVLAAGQASFAFAGDRRSAVLDRARPALVVSLHRRAAELYAALPARAAIHLEQAGDSIAALEEWLRAGRESMAAFDVRSAETYFGRAIAAARCADDLGRQAEALVERGKARDHFGDYEGALRDHERAAELSRQVADIDLEMAALERTAWTIYYSRNSTFGEPLADRALPICEQVVLSPRSGLSVRILLGRLRHASGDTAGATQVLEDLELEVLSENDRVTAELCLSLLRAHTDHYAEAFDLAEAAMANGRRTGQYRHVLTASVQAVVAAFNSGRYGAALDRLEVAAALAGRFDDSLYLVRVATMGAVLWNELGDPGRAWALADETMDRTVAADAARSHTGLHARLAAAEVYMAADPARSLNMLRELERDVRDEVAYRWRLELRRLDLLSRLEPERGEALLALAARTGTEKYTALGLHRMGRGDEAVAHALQLDSDPLLAKVATAPRRRKALDRIAAQLPGDLRGRYLDFQRDRGPSKRA